MTTTLENIVLPARAEVQHLPKKNDITMTSLLLEQRKSHNAFLDILEVLVKEVKSIKKESIANFKLCEKLEERVIPEITETLKSTMSTLESKAVDMQGHGFRLNLICKGREEEDDESPADTEQLFKSVLKDSLGIETADNILFRAVHRLPKPKSGNGSTQPKPIIAAFIRQQDRDTVLSKAHLLKDTGISLQSHLPKKLNDLRNDLLKQRRQMLAVDPSRKLRVVDKNYTPVMQEKRHGATVFTTLKITDQVNNDRRRSSRRNTINIDG